MQTPWLLLPFLVRDSHRLGKALWEKQLPEQLQLNSTEISQGRHQGGQRDGAALLKERLGELGLFRLEEKSHCGLPEPGGAPREGGERLDGPGVPGQGE